MFGLEGKMEIKLAKFNFTPGETIEGTLTLKMKKMVEGEELNIGLVGEKITRSRTGDRSNTRRFKIYDFKQPLGGAGPYTVGEKEIPFKILIPKNVLNESSSPKIEGALGGFIKAAQTLSGQSSRVEWYLLGHLVIKGMMNDIRKKIRINVG